MRIHSRVAVFIFVVSLVVYANAFRNSFHFDDQHYVVENPFIRDLGNVPSFFKSPRYSSFEKGFTSHYRPLVVSSYALNYAWGGLNPAGYHLVNLIFHMGSAFLVYLILQTMLSGSGTRFFPAVAAGLIFVVHPFNTEVVNYITARSSVMCSFFYLLAFWCWMKHRGSHTPLPDPSPASWGRKGWGDLGWYIASLFSFLLAMLSKEIAVTLPLILWIYDLYFMKPKEGTEHNARQKGFLSSNASVYRGYLPFVFLVVIPYLMVRKVFFGSMVFHGSLTDVWKNLITQTGVLTQVIQLLFFPLGLTIEHDIPIPHGVLNPGIIFSIVFLSAFLFSAYYLYKKGGGWKIVSFFILWFFITILPTTIVPLNAILQENRGYLPGVGFSFFAAFVLTHGRWNRRFSVFLLCLLISIYAMITFQRNLVWKNDISLWEDAVSKAHGSPRAHDNLGLAYFNVRHYQEAEKEFKEVVRSHPHYFYAHYNLGVLYQIQGRWDEAIGHYQKAVQISPGFFRAYYNLGLAFKSKGDIEDAIRNYQKAIEIDSRYPFVYNNLGVIYYQEKRYPDAVWAFQEAIDRDPKYAKAYYNLGNVYAELGDNPEAIAAYQAALRIQPEFENARLSLDRILHPSNRH